MDLMASKPRTTLDEDMLKFGIITEAQAQQLREDREAKQKALTESVDEAAEAAAQTETDHEKGNAPVAEAEKDSEKEDEKAEKDDEDEKEDDDEEDEDEDEDEDEMDEDTEFLADLDESEEAEVLNLVDEDCADFEEGWTFLDDALLIAEDDAGLAAALTVIEQFDNLSDEAIENLTVEQALGVISAYDQVVMAESKRSIAKRALKKARRKKKKLQKLGKVKKSTMKAAKKGKVMVGGKAVKAGAQAARAFKKLERSAGSGRMKKLLRKRRKSQMGTSATDVKQRYQGKKIASDVETQGEAVMEGVEAILQSLGQLTAPIQDTQVESATDTGSIDEGFGKVRESAAEIAERIAAEIRAREDVNEDSDIVKAGLYFESLAHDADRQARAFKRGDLDEATAMGDLSVLHDDLKKGIEDLATIA